ncbi:hypothetical protein [Vibrio crassostreae]|uniref:hypothetical protein n=1 Tax=Vibrio crassostreae TaxID=246167 RepID=UPI001B30E8D3|nr:hypothetical protein [Vibrio crassostreae]
MNDRSEKGIAEIEVSVTATLNKEKADVEIATNMLLRNLSARGHHLELPVELDNELWARASAAEFEDNEFLRRAILYKKLCFHHYMKLAKVSRLS